MRQLSRLGVIITLWLKFRGGVFDFDWTILWLFLITMVTNNRAERLPGRQYSDSSTRGDVGGASSIQEDHAHHQRRVPRLQDGAVSDGGVLFSGPHQ